MVLGLKSHLPTHHISPIPLTNPNRTPQTTLNPFFRVKPIETHNFPHLQLKSRSKNPNRFKSGGSNINGGGGGGGGGADDLTKDEDEDEDGDRDGDEVRRFYLRLKELLLSSDRDNVGALGFPGTMAWVCAEVARLLYVEFVEAVELLVVISCMLVGGVVIFGVGVGVALIWHWF